ncbi:minichromosome maintenance domain-containing protein 2-like [Diadema setosum]|uniref:minichromosome maintenance domain-containing protein 2-like n=1 Tax=Diadema setosum TaxID=31175 RepID=UPI003B3A7A73
MLAAAKLQQGDLTLKESVIRYLDQTHQLQSLKDTYTDIQISHEKQVQTYSFCIQVNLSELCQVDADLANMVSNKPSDAHVLFQEVCHTAAKALGVLPDGIKRTQIHVCLRLSSLPQLPGYVLHKRDFFGSKLAPRFYQFVGIVCGMTAPSKYTCCAKYRCPIMKCSGSDDNVYIRFHTAGAKEAQTVRKDFHCFYCGSVLVEDVHGRILGEKVVLKMIPKESTNPKDDTSVFHQSVTVYVRDELIPKVILGSHVNVVGIPIVEHSGTRTSVAFEANNIILEANPTIHLSRNIPDYVQALHADRRSSPWSFSTSMAYLFGSDVAPPGTFHKLKLHLLLSLMQSTDPSNSLHVLAVGKDSHILGRLLQYAASCAQRHVVHGSSTPVFGSVQKDTQTEACSIDGGSVNLAHLGVCLLGDLGVWKKDCRDRLRIATESGFISLGIPRSVEAGPLHTLTLPLQSTLWGYTAPDGKATPHTDLYTTQGIDGRCSTITEGFNLMSVCDNSDQSWDDYKEACLVHRALIGACDISTQDQRIISGNDFRKFILYASQQSVEMTKPAQQLIKGYFIGSRRVRTSSVRGSPFPPSVLKTLSSMASAHAKLSLRREVTENDATLAIWLFEETVTSQYGYSALNVYPLPHFRDGNVGGHLGPENDLRMEQFQQQLLRFCCSHDPDFTMHRPED